MAVFLYLLAGLVLLCLYLSCRRLAEIFRIRRRFLSLGLPTFKGIPLLGNVRELRKNVPGIPQSVFTMQTLEGYKVALREHDMFMFSLGPYCYAALCRPDVVEAALSDNKQVNKSDDYVFLYPWLGTGLITSSYVKWKKLRKKLTPAFHFRILDEFQPIINDYSEILVKKLRTQVGKPYTCLDPFVSNCALDIIAGTALGVDVGAQNDKSPHYCKALLEASESVFARVFSPWLWPDIIFWLSPRGRRMSKSLKIISSFIKNIIREKKEELTESKEEIRQYFENREGSDQKIRKAFLEIMLMHNIIHENDQFSDEDIEDEVNTFTFAGHDTTTTGMNWTLYLIGLYPEVQEKIVEELRDIFGEDRERPVTLDDTKRMSYLDRVIKESQRLYPSVPIIGRKLNEDFTLMGITIPKGVAMFILVSVLHRDPESFPNPEVFDPDRFLVTNNRHPFAYVPFSAGPRNCLGQRFAMHEMKTVLANVIRNYKLTSLDPRDKVLMCNELVSRPAKPIRTKIELRV